MIFRYPKSHRLSSISCTNGEDRSEGSWQGRASSGVPQWVILWIKSKSHLIWYGLIWNGMFKSFINSFHVVKCHIDNYSCRSYLAICCDMLQYVAIPSSPCIYIYIMSLWYYIYRLYIIYYIYIYYIYHIIYIYIIISYIYILNYIIYIYIISNILYIIYQKYYILYIIYIIYHIYCNKYILYT